MVACTQSCFSVQWCVPCGVNQAANLVFYPRESRYRGQQVLLLVQWWRDSALKGISLRSHWGYFQKSLHVDAVRNFNERNCSSSLEAMSESSRSLLAVNDNFIFFVVVRIQVSVCSVVVDILLIFVMLSFCCLRLLASWEFAHYCDSALRNLQSCGTFLGFPLQIQERKPSKICKERPSFLF